MRMFWTRDHLIRRIDRCYLIATWARAEERRALYLGLAHHYRQLLARLAAPVAATC